MGLEFQPKNNIQLISSQTIQTKLLCSYACLKVPSCRTLDYDLVSKRCRLFEGDSTTGSTNSSTSTTSFVGTIYISSSLYSPTHNQPCQACQQSRYEICSSNTRTCQCPSHTYWDGSICALQLFANDTCGQSDACRPDMNLTCSFDCYGGFSQCQPSVFDNMTLSSTPMGVTVAGGCNDHPSTNQTILSSPSAIGLGYNNILYIKDNTGKLYMFQQNSRTGLILGNFGVGYSFVFFDSRMSTIYVGMLLTNRVQILSTNMTIPPNPIASCLTNAVWGPAGITVDSGGNVYIASIRCNWIMKWAPNATNGTVVAGSPLGVSGNNSQSLYMPGGLALDEINSFIYVADRLNHRIQRFPLNGSGIGVTVAGGNGSGSAANQLNTPTDIFLSKLDGSIYIADWMNSRIQKWQMNATAGTTIAGSPNGTAGNTSYLLNQPYGLIIDDEEKYLYVSDTKNNRIQRFTLY